MTAPGHVGYGRPTRDGAALRAESAFCRNHEAEDTERTP